MGVVNIPLNVRFLAYCFMYSLLVWLEKSKYFVINNDHFMGCFHISIFYSEFFANCFCDVLKLTCSVQFRKVVNDEKRNKKEGKKH